MQPNTEFLVLLYSLIILVVIFDNTIPWCDIPMWSKVCQQTADSCWRVQVKVWVMHGHYGVPSPTAGDLNWKSSSSTIRLRPLGLFLPPGNHLPYHLWSSYITSSFRFVFFFFFGILLFIICICFLQFILYCVNLSLILEMPNCSLMSLLLSFVPKCISCHWSYKSHFSSFNFPLVWSV